MRHIFFLDSLDKLVIKKDSTLMLALTLQQQGREVYLLFEEDLYLSNQNIATLTAYSFAGAFHPQSYYLNDFQINEPQEIQLQKESDILHIRLDPPFDARYLKYTWMLYEWQKKGLKIINSPKGILVNNEKLSAFRDEQKSIATFVGQSPAGFQKFIQKLKEQGCEEVIFKPIDLFQGLGVEKLGINDENLLDKFCQKTSKISGPIIVQPFMKEVIKGEVRATYYGEQEIGTILKVPPEGEFLANIARGAKFSAYQLTPTQRRACEEYAREMTAFGAPWIAFDLLGENVTEINITCPALLVETSEALQQNVAEKMIPLIEEK